MKIFKELVKRILKKFGFSLKIYSEFNLEQINFSTLGFKKSKNFIFKSYRTKEGKEYKLFKNYRYNLKRAYLSYPSIKNLFFLSSKIKNNKKLKHDVLSFIGTETLTCPISEIKLYADNEIKKYPDLFLEKNNKFFPKIDEKKFFLNLQSQIRWTKNYLSTFGLKKSKMKILEVGPGTGMLSISLSALGHEVTGIDKNYFEEDLYSRILRENYQSLARTKVNFVDGDITRYKKFKNNYFDLILSISVLEHIKNFPLLISKFKNILHKDGFLLHKYAHFWSEEGAHSLGNLDAPWLHTIIKGDELKRYLKTIRPYEYKMCMNWINNCLNRKINSAYVQRELGKNKFSILYWNESKNHKKRLQNLRPEIINEILYRNPEISLSDLICSDTTFLSSNIK